MQHTPQSQGAPPASVLDLPRTEMTVSHVKMFICCHEWHVRPRHVMPQSGWSGGGCGGGSSGGG